METNNLKLLALLFSIIIALFCADCNGRLSLRVSDRKMFFFDGVMYTQWSNWSKCDESICSQFRYRKCKDNSWESGYRSSSSISELEFPSPCPVKFVAERRPCENKTRCLTDGPVVDTLPKECGHRRESRRIVARIYGGKPAKPYTWPWHVGVSVPDLALKHRTLCGGTLLNKRWVITAAHCIGQTSTIRARLDETRSMLSRRTRLMPNAYRQKLYRQASKVKLVKRQVQPRSVVYNTSNTYKSRAIQPKHWVVSQLPRPSSGTARRRSHARGTNYNGFNNVFDSLISFALGNNLGLGLGHGRHPLITLPLPGAGFGSATVEPPPKGVLFDLSKTPGYATINIILDDHYRTKKDKSERVIRASKAIIHPNYKNSPRVHRYDLALIRLDKPAPTEPIHFACMPDENFTLPVDQECVAVGWGYKDAPKSYSRQEQNTAVANNPQRNRVNGSLIDLNDIMQAILGQNSKHRQGLSHLSSSALPSSTSFRGPSNTTSSSSASSSSSSVDAATDVSASAGSSSILSDKLPVIPSIELREVHLPLLDIEECSDRFDALQKGVHLCAGMKGRDTCKGDSGGGLYCRKNGDDRWHLYGITSYGGSKGCGHGYGIYMSVPGSSKWIKKVIANYS